MRMIDADALIRKFKTASPMAIDGRARQMVEEMPTIEERKTGKWIKHSIGHEHTPWGFDCSECGEWFVVGEEVIKKYNYCPNCGSYNGGDNYEADTKAS